MPLASVMLVITRPSIAQLALRLMLLTVDDPFSVMKSETSVMFAVLEGNNFHGLACLGCRVVDDVRLGRLVTHHD